MVNKVSSVAVFLWGHEVGRVDWDEEQSTGVFQYHPDFLKLDLDVSPIMMPTSRAIGTDMVFKFPPSRDDELKWKMFQGLPGLLADSLPDRFGNKILENWLYEQGRDRNSLNPIERLSYIGTRGMGALEFVPSTNPGLEKAVPVEVDHLVALANKIVQNRNELDVELGQNDKANIEAINDIIRVGTSAGGARPKAVIAMNNDGHVLSGQTKAPPGYEHWLLKFDGVDDKEINDPTCMSRVEYAYYKMALESKIDISESRLFRENGRAHFMTKRFDREAGEKLHMQTISGIGHLEFKSSYETVFSIMRDAGISRKQQHEQFRRMVFNVLSRNHDDHTKNTALLMGQDGKWKLAPMYDVTYSYNPHGNFTESHQLSINGKHRDFTIEDFIRVGESININRPQDIVKEVQEVVSRWPDFAKESGLEQKVIQQIQNEHQRIAKTMDFTRFDKLSQAVASVPSIHDKPVISWENITTENILLSKGDIAFINGYKGYFEESKGGINQYGHDNRFDKGYDSAKQELTTLLISKDKSKALYAYRGLDLTDTDFTSADLRRLDLRNADLENSKLERAKLERSDLRGVNLRGVDLSKVDLDGAKIDRKLERELDKHEQER